MIKYKAKKISIIVAIITALTIFIILMIRENKKENNFIENENINSSTTINLENNSTTTVNDLINKNNIKDMDNENITEATINTNFGKITIEFSTDKPKTTENFIKLAKSGFYNGVRFHRVISGFMIQTGDPLSKDEANKSYWGTGGPGYKFADELTGNEKYTVGTVAMANSGPNTNGSQFFIMTSNTNLPPAYTVFGKVVTGQDVAQKIDLVATDGNDRPLEDVLINSIDLK